MTKLNTSEADTKKTCEDYLQYGMNQGKWWFTRLNSGIAYVKHGEKYYAVKLCEKGTADMVVITNNGRYDAPNKMYPIVDFIEFKSEKGRTSRFQDEFAELVRKQACGYHVIRSLEDLRAIVEV